MAPSFPTIKTVSAFVVSNRVYAAASRRGYAAVAVAAADAAAQSGSAGGGGVASNMMLKKGMEESGKATTSWVPDPVTGYYRPENLATEIDAADLRAMLLKNKIGGN